MTIKFLLMVNKQGQTRLAKYTDPSMTTEQKRSLESEVVRKCITRSTEDCSVVEHRGFKVIYRRYASLFFMMGIDEAENELICMELCHCLVETLDKYFKNVCELDIMMHIASVHIIVDELLANGCIAETSKVAALETLNTMTKTDPEAALL